MPKYEMYFKYKYDFDSKGNIVGKSSRNITDASRHEFERFVRISFDSVDDFHDKSAENRNATPNISIDALQTLYQLRKSIESNNYENGQLFSQWINYLDEMQNELLADWLE